MMKKVLIANRGAIATRIIRTLRGMGITSVAVFAEADRDSLHVRQADEAYCLGEGGAAQTYLDQQTLLQLALQQQVDAIHPGYGFLSENADFVCRCEEADIVFLGPTAQQIESFGLKHRARQLADECLVPLLPGSALLADVQQALAAATEIGYPVMLKSTAGGGGIGMQVCADADQLAQAFDSVQRLAGNHFSNADVFLEKYIERARHIEVQIFGDGQGQVLALAERDCSAQRRHQKVIEETPAPNLPDAVAAELQRHALNLARRVQYRSAGTVEFIVDQHTHELYFLEVNTRLQVEHGVTECLYNIDIVQWMLLLGAGSLADLTSLGCTLKPSGHAIQVRIYAENPQKVFQPCAGLLTQVYFPNSDVLTSRGLRIDHWLEAGLEVPALFDPMLAKVIAHADSREAALAQLQWGLAETELYGIETNIDYLRSVLAEPVWLAGQMDTRYLNRFDYQSHTVEVLSGGTFTTIQDYPGRRGYWDVGVPPSGPFDSVSLRLGNQLLGNSPSAAALELTLHGPTLRFHCDTVIVLTGAPMQASLDQQPLSFWSPLRVRAGQCLQIGGTTGAGARAYLCIAGGFQCPDYLGSQSTFSLGQFGGHGGRILATGDVLHLAAQDAVAMASALATEVLVEDQLPTLASEWQLHVIYGPHGAPDFFTEADIEQFFAASWQVHYHSSRTGIRLIGPKPSWARCDGGEAGMHPSNIHDNAYAIGAVDFTGDVPVILGPDGPSLGGFVCPVTVIQADLWKLGQLKAGDRLRFIPVSMEAAVAAQAHQEAALTQGRFSSPAMDRYLPRSPVIRQVETSPEQRVALCYRPSGDQALLVEFGPLQLDIELRFCVHAFMLWLKQHTLPGIRELTPGIRSLQIQYDSQQLPLADLLQHLQQAEQALTDVSQLQVPTRVVHLPLSWDDDTCRQAIEKYQQSVRQEAPWCPSNIEFIRRINGLSSIDEVKQLVFEATYLVMGLGDVYLGAPVATPLDPCHRLVTTKYNPARTWTAENSVGIGGSYLCIYGMEGPGGYQLIGRTLQMWNRYRQTEVFDRPWLLEFFDQIRFYPVSAQELAQIRRDFPKGDYPIRIEHSTFSLAQYQEFLQGRADDIQQFTESRERAFATELQHWRDTGQLDFAFDEVEVASEQDVAADDEWLVESGVAGSVWQALVAEGDSVVVGDTLMVIESMKMEIPVLATEAGRVSRLLRQPGQSVASGQALLALAAEP